MSYSANYYRSLIEGYKALGKDVGQEVWDNLRDAEEREAADQVQEKWRATEFEIQEEKRLKAFQEEFFVYEDLGWPAKGAGNYRGAHTLRALAIFRTLPGGNGGRNIGVVHGELLALFNEANKDRQKGSVKHTNERQWLASRTEIPNWLVRAWCAAMGLECTFSKPFGGSGMLLRPGVVPDDGLLLLTKDWVCMRGGKIHASWNPLWHDHRAVNGVWVRPQ